MKDFLVEESSPGVRSGKPYTELQLEVEEAGAFRREFSFPVWERERANRNAFVENGTAEINWEHLMLVQMEVETGR